MDASEDHMLIIMISMQDIEGGTEMGLWQSFSVIHTEP